MVTEEEEEEEEEEERKEVGAIFFSHRQKFFIVALDSLNFRKESTFGSNDATDVLAFF